MLDIELVEGKDHPGDISPDEYENIGETVALLVRLCCHIYSTGKVVIIDSGFCVLQGIIKLRKLFFCASALVKKIWYWPTLVPGDAIYDHFSTKGHG